MCKERQLMKAEIAFSAIISGLGLVKFSVYDPDIAVSDIKVRFEIISVT